MLRMSLSTYLLDEEHGLDWISRQGFYERAEWVMAIAVLDARNQLFDRATEIRTIVQPDDGKCSPPSIEAV